LLAVAAADFPYQSRENPTLELPTVSQETGLELVISVLLLSTEGEVHYLSVSDFLAGQAKLNNNEQLDA
jgi:hypothetical protein